LSIVQRQAGVFAAVNPEDAAPPIPDDMVATVFGADQKEVAMVVLR
jgi:hypothetical protein